MVLMECYSIAGTASANSELLWGLFRPLPRTDASHDLIQARSGCSSGSGYHSTSNSHFCTVAIVTCNHSGYDVYLAPSKDSTRPLFYPPSAAEKGRGEWKKSADGWCKSSRHSSEAEGICWHCNCTAADTSQLHRAYIHAQNRDFSCGKALGPYLLVTFFTQANSRNEYVKN